MTEPSSPAAIAPSADARVRWWEPLLAFVGGNLIGGIVSVVAGVVLLFAVARHGPASPNAVESLLYSFPAIMSSVALADVAMVAVTWWLVRRRGIAPMASYFPAVPVGTVALAAISGVVLSLILNGGNQLLSDAHIIAFTDTPIERAMVPHGVLAFLASAAVVSLLAPFCEEFVFRGLLMRWFKPLAGSAGAILISGLVFGLVHGQFFQHPDAQGWLYTVELVIAGIVLGLWAARTGSLRTSFATHAAYNLTATIFSVLQP